MTHATCLVAIPGEGDVKKLIAHEMAPYDETDEWFRDGSRWDWWVIGGRWTGSLVGYEPAKDPRNWESCFICGGTGTRRDHIAAARGIRDGYCNGCSDDPAPIGMAVKFPSKWAPCDGDVITVAKAFEYRSRVTAHAFLMDRHWHESARMGWFGSTCIDESGQDAEPMRFRHDDGSEALLTTHNINEQEWSESFFQRFIEPLPTEMRIALVDYHV